MKTPQLLFPAAVAAALAPAVLISTAGAAAIPVNPKNTVTATMDGGTAKTGNTWYELGVNTAAPTTGLKTGLVAGQADTLSTYLFQASDKPNALMLDNGTKTGSLQFNTPLTMAAMTIVGASGNGAGTVTPTLKFADSTTKTLAAITVGDWFNNSPRVQTTSGRLNADSNAYGNVGQDNPRVLGITLSLTGADATKAISAIDLSWTGGANTHTAIFGVSGDFTGIGHYSAIPLAPASFNQDMIIGVTEAVPEPGTMALFGLGAAGLFLARRRAQA